MGLMCGSIVLEKFERDSNFFENISVQTSTVSADQGETRIQNIIYNYILKF